jgi:hypothetical protein
MPPAGWRKSKGKMNGAAESAQAALGASGITPPPDRIPTANPNGSTTPAAHDLDRWLIAPDRQISDAPAMADATLIHTLQS